MKRVSLTMVVIITTLMISLLLASCTGSSGMGSVGVRGDRATVVYRVNSDTLDIAGCAAIVDATADSALHRSVTSAPPNSRSFLGHELQSGKVGEERYPDCGYWRVEQITENVPDPDDPTMRITRPVSPPMWRHYYTVDTSNGWSRTETVDTGDTVRLYVSGAGIIYNASITVDGQNCASASTINGEFNHTCRISSRTSSRDDNYDGNNSFNTANVIAIDASTDAEIDPAGDEDYYRVEVSSDTDLRFYTTGSIDTEGFLYNGDTNQIASNGDGGAGENFQISRRLTTGTYYVRVRADGTGSYTLHVED